MTSFSTVFGKHCGKNTFLRNYDGRLLASKGNIQVDLDHKREGAEGKSCPDSTVVGSKVEAGKEL